MASNYSQSQVNQRLVFENAKQICVDAGVPTVAAQLTESFLRLEQVLVTTRAQYQFPILVNNNGPANTLLNTETRLNQQDSLISYAWGFFVANPSSATDTTFRLNTYGNPQTYATALAAVALNTLYNSYFNIAVNNKIVLPAWDAFRHMIVPQTQNGVGVTAQTIFNQDELDGSGDGFYPIEHNLVWIGSQNIVINLIMPAALGTVNTAFTRAVVIFRGLLAINSTIIT